MLQKIKIVVISPYVQHGFDVITDSLIMGMEWLLVDYNSLASLVEFEE